MMDITMRNTLFSIAVLLISGCKPVDLHPLVAAPVVALDPDTDGDGFLDLEEAEAGSDAQDPFSWDFGGDRWPDFTDEALADGVTGAGYGMGQVIPDFSGEDQFGNTVSLYQFYGYVVVLDFVAGWCGPCSDVASTAQTSWEAQRLDGLIYIHVVVDDDDGVGVVDPDFAASWANRHQLEFPVLHDDTYDALNGVDSSGLYVGDIPFLIVLDRDLRIDSAHVGTGGAVDADKRASELL